MDNFIKITGKEKENASSSICLCSSDEEQSTSTSTKRTKGISSVWKYFKRSDDKRLAKCMKCSKEYKTSGNTTNLRDHLTRMHPNLEDKENLELASADFSMSSRQSSTRSVDSYFKRAVQYDASSMRKKDIDRALAKFVAVDFQPFRVVDDTGFKNLVKILDPRYVIPSRETLKNVYIKNMYDECTIKLQHLLGTVDYVAVTSDLWSSMANESYITVTCHFIEAKFQLQTYVLSTKQLNDPSNHCAQNIADSLTAVFEEWNVVDKVVCVVTDNAKVMLKACEIMGKQNLPCFAHSLNLVVQDSLVAVGSIIAKCKKIVQFFKKSCTANDKFKNAQNCAVPLKLIQDVSTRWNSTYLMLQRIIEVKDALSSVLLSTLKAPSPLTAEEHLALDEIVKLLSPFFKATEQCSANSVTSSLIIPLINGIFQKLESEEINSEVAKLLKQELLQAMRKRLCVYELIETTTMATLLDPRFKEVAFMCNANALAAVKKLESLIEPLIEDTIASPQKNVNTDSLLSFLEKAKECQKLDSSNAVKHFLDMKHYDQNLNPLDFWKVVEHNMLPLKELSLKYLCVPATSVESERTFSKAGMIISNRRSRLKQRQVDRLVFLNKNHSLQNNKI